MATMHRLLAASIFTEASSISPEVSSQCMSSGLTSWSSRNGICVWMQFLVETQRIVQVPLVQRKIFHLFAFTGQGDTSLFRSEQLWSHLESKHVISIRIMRSATRYRNVYVYSASPMFDHSGQRGQEKSKYFNELSQIPSLPHLLNCVHWRVVSRWKTAVTSHRLSLRVTTVVSGSSVFLHRLILRGTIVVSGSFFLSM